MDHIILPKDEMIVIFLINTILLIPMTIIWDRPSLSFSLIAFIITNQIIYLIIHFSFYILFML